MMLPVATKEAHAPLAARVLRRVRLVLEGIILALWNYEAVWRMRGRR